MATETDITDKTPLAPFIADLGFFHAAWVYFLFPAMKTLGEATLVYAMANNSIRLLVWVLPVFCYLRYVDGVDPFEYLKRDHSWRRGLFVGLILTGINCMRSVIPSGVPDPSAPA